MPTREELLRQWTELTEGWHTDYLAEMLQDVLESVEEDRRILNEQLEIEQKEKGCQTSGPT